MKSNGIIIDHILEDGLGKNVGISNLTSPEFRHTCEVHPGFRAVSW